MFARQQNIKVLDLNVLNLSEWNTESDELQLFAIRHATQQVLLRLAVQKNQHISNSIRFNPIQFRILNHTDNQMMSSLH